MPDIRNRVNWSRTDAEGDLPPTSSAEHFRSCPCYAKRHARDCRNTTACMECTCGLFEESVLPTTPEQVQTEQKACGYCGTIKWDHKHGGTVSCTSCCAIHGGTVDEPAYDLIQCMFDNNVKNLAERDYWRSLFKQNHKHSYETITELGRVADEAIKQRDIERIASETIAHRTCGTCQDAWFGQNAKLVLESARGMALRDWEKAHPEVK